MLELESQGSFQRRTIERPVRIIDVACGVVEVKGVFRWVADTLLICRSAWSTRAVHTTRPSTARKLILFVGSERAFGSSKSNNQERNPMKTHCHEPE